ncbi:MAG TPA: hypothetical protein VJA44_05390 [Acidimicrobiia bacterium]|nr:hypothetical protein [Acidimicrobiia bacterium]
MEQPPVTPGPRTFLERRRWDTRNKLWVAEPLRERLLVYVKVFLLGLVAISVIALVIFLASSARLTHAFGYSSLASGTLCLLAGGARGGGFANIAVGAAGALVGARNTQDDDVEHDADVRHGKVMKRRDPMERLRRGLRPPPNPTAFWSAVAGFLYIAIGIPFTL